jgi:serine/threonine protein kinase
MIEKLAKFPHDHITPYLATWIQDNHPCILFPKAKCNLRTFMTTQEEPELNRSFVLWFLKQFKGLAGAVAHFHWISDERSGSGTSSESEGNQGGLGSDLRQNKHRKTGLAGVHHDIRPENILVFEKSSTQSQYAGIFQISDFGAGRFANLALGEMSAPAKRMKGTLTYRGPEEKPSRPFDIWALGCVFLELLIWALTPEQDGGNGFSDRRGWISDSKHRDSEPTNPVDDAFWVRDPITHEVKLRDAVDRQIDDLLHTHCRGRKAFSRVTQITKKLFTIVPSKRPLAKDILIELKDIYKEAQDDLDADRHCYMKQHTGTHSALHPGADAFHTPMEAPLAEPEGAHDRSPKRPLDEDSENESEEASPRFLKRRRKSSTEGKAPPASEAALNIVEPTPFALPEAQGAESEDDALRHIEQENIIPRSRQHNQKADSEPWQPG